MYYVNVLRKLNIERFVLFNKLHEKLSILLLFSIYEIYFGFSYTCLFL